GLTVDPGVHVDPVGQLIRALAIPGEVFGEVAIRFGAVIAEAAEDIDANFLTLAKLRDCREELEELRDEVDAAPLHLDEPGLVVNAGGDHVHLVAVDRRVFRYQALTLGPVLDAA